MKKLSRYSILAGAVSLAFWAAVRIIVLADYPQMVQGLQVIAQLFTPAGFFVGVAEMLRRGYAERIAQQAGMGYARHRNTKDSPSKDTPSS